MHSCEFGHNELATLYFCRDATGHHLQVSEDEGIYVAGQIVFGIAGLVIGTVILDDVVWVNRHRANLRPEVGLHMFAFEPRCLLLAPLLFTLIETSLEQLQSYFAVL